MSLYLKIVAWKIWKELGG